MEKIVIIIILLFLISASAFSQTTQLGLMGLIHEYNEKVQSPHLLMSKSMFVVHRALRQSDPAVFSRLTNIDILLYVYTKSFCETPLFSTSMK